MKINFYDTQIAADYSISLVKEKELSYDIKSYDGPESVVKMMNHLFKLNCAAEEHCYMVTLNTKCEPLGIFLISKGTVNKSLLEPREVYMKALLNGSVYVILLHNHPSKVATPSSVDLLTTKG